MSETRVSQAGHSANQGRAMRAIAHAADRTGIDFDFLLAQARLESGLDSSARARTSSATGLFQFIEQTWLRVLHRHGAQHGLGPLASAINVNGGKAAVAAPQLRSQILALRDDPAIAALMAGELARDNRNHLVSVLGREPDEAELYLAHFLGAGGAARFLGALANSPGSPAAVGFAGAAQANRAIFHAPDGSARSYAQVMALLRARLEKAGAEYTGPPEPASFGAIAPQPRAGFAFPVIAAPASFGSGFERIPISALLVRGLAAGAGDAGKGETQAADHARRAYTRLKAFGL